MGGSSRENHGFQQLQKGIIFLGNHDFFLIIVIQHYTFWIYSDFNQHLVYFIKQNYPVTRECNEADWLDPLVAT